MSKLRGLGGRTYRQTDRQTAIFESDMVYTSEGLTDKIIMSTNSSIHIKNPGARKSLHNFSEVLYFKQKAAVRRLSADK